MKIFQCVLPIVVIESGFFLSACADNAGKGSLSNNRNPLFAGFVSAANECLDLIGFFKSLTDREFVCNADFADSSGNILLHPACPR